VNFHINNVVSKLGASNKTQAAVKAAALGMLF
jgi:DNA-binding CsgD family transcriptional regulator